MEPMSAHPERLRGRRSSRLLQRPSGARQANRKSPAASAPLPTPVFTQMVPVP